MSLSSASIFVFLVHHTRLSLSCTSLVRVMVYVQRRYVEFFSSFFYSFSYFFFIIPLSFAFPVPIQSPARRLFYRFVPFPVAVRLPFDPLPSNPSTNPNHRQREAIPDKAKKVHQSRAHHLHRESQNSFCSNPYPLRFTRAAIFHPRRETIDLKDSRCKFSVKLRPIIPLPLSSPLSNVSSRTSRLFPRLSCVTHDIYHLNLLFSSFFSFFFSSFFFFSIYFSALFW